MKNRSQVIISRLDAGFLSPLQAEHVVVVVDHRGVSVEAEISYEDGRRFSDAEVQPVFRVYEHGSESVYVDVPTLVDPLRTTFDRKKVKGRVPDRIDTVGTIEILSFREMI